MCGLAGVIRADGQPIAVGTVAKMAASIAHRGPDSDGVWAEGPVGLGHRRLSIIDLTPSAHQPMTNETGHLVIVYNGEVYNFQSLRMELETAGHRFHSHSDTEVVLHAYEEWGEGCLERFDGMFAFAIWDKRTKRLFAARDRFGVKPLYWFFDGAKLIFGSEIKAILAYPGVRRAVSLPALNEYFTFQNIFSDLTLFDGIRLLPPGSSLTFDVESGKDPVLRRYWDYDFSSPLQNIDSEEASGEVRRLFTAAVTRQLVSDVPVGCYLSGGMDSGSIAAVATRQRGRLMTFTAGFDLSSASGLELNFDERVEAEFLSNVLNTEQYEMILHSGDMEQVIPDLIWHLEDLRVGQCYPNFCVSRLAGKFVKVVLSGAGGDEVFGGYPWRYQRGMAATDAASYHGNYYKLWQRLVPDGEKSTFFNERTFRQMAGHSTADAMRSVYRADMPLETQDDFANASLYFELKTFMHGLLVVEDKVSMAHGLETRVPFLDNALVDFACKLPPHHKLGFDESAPSVDENVLRPKGSDIRTATGKRVLRNAMLEVIPPEVTNRKKQGFSGPDATWFRGQSIDYVNALLRNPRGLIYDYIRPEYVVRILDEHTAGKHNHRLLIWSLVSFEWWLRKFMAS